MKRIYAIASLTAAFALTAAAQDADMQKKLQDEVSSMLTRIKVVGIEGGVMSNVKNAPYQATQVTETNQTLGDGTRIHNEHQVTIYRDSQGRVRRESPDQISIWDPGTGVGYTLNPKTMTASKRQISISVAPGGSRSVAYSVRTETSSGGSGAGGMVIQPAVRAFAMANSTSAGEVSTFQFKTGDAAGGAKKESLGTQIMEGVGAQGERETNTIEAGAIGNDRPIQIVSERWYSADLQTEVMTRSSDPRTGETVTKLININRAEPDSSLFQLPAGYKINEEKGMPPLPPPPGIKIQKQ